MFEDEASFWVDGTLHQTWARIGAQPSVPTYGQRKTAHVFGAIGLQDARFSYQFADVLNGRTFFTFLKQLARRYPTQKVFLIIDNSPAHRLEPDGVEWLRKNQHRIELCRLPAYSPEYNPMEGVWKQTRKRTTHNNFFESPAHRDTALRKTFLEFQRTPELIAPQVARFL